MTILSMVLVFIAPLVIFAVGCLVWAHRAEKNYNDDWWT